MGKEIQRRKHRKKEEEVPTKTFPLIATSVVLLFLLCIYNFHEDICSVSYPPPDFSSSSPIPAVLVTGASRGVGKDIAFHLAENGFLVFAGVRKTEDGLNLVASYHEQMHEDNHNKKNNIRPLILDVTEDEDVMRVYQTITEMDAEESITFHGLVHNAAIIGTGPMESLSTMMVEKVVDVNFKAPILLTHTFLPLLRTRQARVVFVSSLGEITPFGFHGPYEATKRGLSAFADLLRRELSPFKVYVGAVLPGLMPTDMYSQAMAEGEIGEHLDGDLKELFEEFYSPESVEFRSKYLYNLIHSPRECSEAILHSLTSPVPHTSYLVGPHAPLMRIFRVFPDWFMDRQAQVLYWPGPMGWGVMQTESTIVLILSLVFLLSLFSVFFCGLVQLFS